MILETDTFPSHRSVAFFSLNAFFDDESLCFLSCQTDFIVSRMIPSHLCADAFVFLSMPHSPCSFLPIGLKPAPFQDCTDIPLVRWSVIPRDSAFLTKLGYSTPPFGPLSEVHNCRIAPVCKVCFLNRVINSMKMLAMPYISALSLEQGVASYHGTYSLFWAFGFTASPSLL